jgi:hypothetical protein
MTCPLLRRSQTPHCNAVAGGPLPVVREVVAAFCRDTHQLCPAFRYFRATGSFAHPADFRAWVIRRIAPGRFDPAPDATSFTDPA